MWWLELGRIVVAPPAHPVVFTLYFILLLPILIVSQGILTAAFYTLGVNPVLGALTSMLMLTASLILSPVNIVVKEVGSGVPRVEHRVGYVYFMGIPVPVVSRVVVEDKVLLAVNVGGALVPVLVSAGILALVSAKHPSALPGILAATLVTTLVVYAAARPVPGVGIVVPSLIPPIVAAVAAVLVLGDRPLIFPAAYVAGTLGSLLGADVLRLSRDFRVLTEQMGTKLLSIGGAGVFDGVYLSGLMAVIVGAMLY